MKKTDDMPMWVYLAFSSVETRKAALSLICGCLAFSLYCVPWAIVFTGHAWVGRVFLLRDWSWFVWMVPTMFWYLMSLRWMDSHSGWAMVVQG